MKTYRFSPIKDKESLNEAIAYIVKLAETLCEKVINARLPITYLTIFSHYEDEYQRLLQIIEGLGKVSKANNGFKVWLSVPLQIGGENIANVRIRRPDPERPQVGCCDFHVDDYETFKQKSLDGNSRLRLIKRPKYEMIEFFDAEFDILAYVVNS